VINTDCDFLLGILVGSCLQDRKELPNGLADSIDVMPLPFRNLISLLGKKTASPEEVREACWKAKVRFEDGDTIISAVTRQLTEKYLRDKQKLLIKKATYGLVDSKDRQDFLSDALFIEGQIAALSDGLEVAIPA